MVDYLKQNFFRAIGVFDEEQVIAELIIDGKFMTLKLEVEPHSDYAVRDKFGNFRARERFEMLAEFIEKYDFRHIYEMPRAALKFAFEQISNHQSADLNQFPSV